MFAFQGTSNVQAARPVFSKLVNNVVRLLFLDLLKAKLWPSQWEKHSSGTSFKNSRKVRHWTFDCKQITRITGPLHSKNWTFRRRMQKVQYYGLHGLLRDHPFNIYTHNIPISVPPIYPVLKNYDVTATKMHCYTQCAWPTSSAAAYVLNGWTLRLAVCSVPDRISIAQQHWISFYQTVYASG